MRTKPRHKLKDDEIRRLALRFINSSFIDNGEIKTISPTEPGDWEKTGSSPISLHDVLAISNSRPQVFSGQKEDGGSQS